MTNMESIFHRKTPLKRNNIYKTWQLLVCRNNCQPGQRNVAAILIRYPLVYIDVARAVAAGDDDGHGKRMSPIFSLYPLSLL